MYNDEIYSVRYAFDPIYNQETGYDYYSGAPEPHYPYPMPCPEYPSMPATPPMMPLPHDADAPGRSMVGYEDALLNSA